MLLRCEGNRRRWEDSPEKIEIEKERDSGEEKELSTNEIRS